MSVTLFGRVRDLFAVCGGDEDKGLWADMIRFFERMRERPLPLTLERSKSPWLASVRLPGLEPFVSATEWLGNFEESVTWAWLENGRPLR
jgi:hypothetical protein